MKKKYMRIIDRGSGDMEKKEENKVKDI